jgi:hypothetical protein
MNFKTTIVLVAMLLLLGSVVLWVHWINPNVGAPPEGRENFGTSTGKYLFEERDLPRKEGSTSQPQVTSITIAPGPVAAAPGTPETPGTPAPIRIVRDGANWTQAEPIRYPMENDRIDNLVVTAATLRYSRTLKAGEDGNPTLDQMKLSPPLVTLTFEVGNGHTQVLRLGRVVPGTRLAYLLKNDDPTVYVVEEALDGVIMPADSDPEATVKDWRSKDLPMPAIGQVEEVQFTQGGTTIDLISRGQQWSFAAPQSGRASAEAVKGLISATAVRVEKFVDDHATDLLKYGLDHPTLSVSLRVPAPMPVTGAASTPATQPAALPGAGAGAGAFMVKTLRLGNVADQYFATWSETSAGGGAAEPSRMVFGVSKYYAEQLTKTTPDSLRDPRLITTAAADVKEIAISRGGKTAFTLVRKPEMEGLAQWTFGDPKPAYEPDQAEVNRLLSAIAEAKALSYVPDVKPKAPALAVVKITGTPGGPAGKGQDETETLTVYPPDQPDGPAVAVRNAETVGYRVSPERFERITGPVVALRDRKVLGLEGATITGLAVRLTGKEAREYKFARSVVWPTAPATQPAAASQPATTQPQTPSFGPWQLNGSEKFETAALDDLIRELTPLRAERWLAPTATASSAPEQIIVDISAVRGHASISCHLHLDPKTRRAYLDPQSPFEASPALVAAAGVEFRDRNALPIAAKDTQKITVTRTGRSVTLEKNDTGQYAATDGRKVDQSAAGGLFDTVAGLRVEHYTQAPTGAIPGAGTLVHVVMREGKTFDLQLVETPSGATDQAHLAHLGDQWFTLSDETVKKLEADPIAKDDAGAPAP